MRQKQSAADRTFTIFAHTFILLFTLFCVFPFLLMIIGSFTDEQELIAHGYTLFPQALSLDAYKAVLQSDVLFNGYAVTIFITVVGALTALCISAMLGYSLANKRNVLQTPFLFFAICQCCFPEASFHFILWSVSGCICRIPSGCSF